MKRVVGILVALAVATSALAATEHIPGDLDFDGDVDFDDFVSFARNFGKRGGAVGSDTVTDTDTIRVEPLNERGFPLAAGNMWKYQLTHVLDLLDTLEVEHFEVDWEVDEQEEVFGVPAFRIKTTQSIRTAMYPDSTEYTSYGWYASSSDTLKAVAHQGVPPLGEGQLLRPAALASAEDLSQWEHIALLFPLEPGMSWQAGLWMTKTVVGKDTVSVPAGSFETYKVRSVWSSPETIIVTWYGAVGVVKIVYMQPPGTLGVSEHVPHLLRVYELVSFRLN